VSLTALDTGFFVRLLQGDGRAVDRWRALVEGEGEGVVSGLSLVELLRLSLKGAIGREDAGLLLGAIPAVCRMVWPDWTVGERSARRFGAPSPNERLPRPGPAPGGRPRPGHRPGGGGGGALDHGRPPDGLRGADAGGQALALHHLPLPPGVQEHLASPPPPGLPGGPGARTSTQQAFPGERRGPREPLRVLAREAAFSSEEGKKGCSNLLSRNLTFAKSGGLAPPPDLPCTMEAVL
jgi:hypothetical protein